MNYILSTLYSLAFCQWNQEEFVIASWWDPRMTGEVKQDEAGLDVFIEAGFNLLTGTGNFFNKNYTPNTGGIVCNKYRLERVEAINNRHDSIVLKTFIEDRRYTARSHIPTKLNMEEYINLKHININQYNAIYGYYISDEPSFDEMKKLTRKLKIMSDYEPSKVIWINMRNSGGNIDNFYGSGHSFYEYVNTLAKSGSKLLTFDYYTFEEESDIPKTYLTVNGNYWANHQILAEVAKKYRIPFWTYILSSQHRFPNRKPVKQYIKRIESILRHSVFSPIIYGAKGIIWFGYECQCNNRPGGDRECPDAKPVPNEMYYDAIVDNKGNLTETGKLVKTINHEVKNIGPVLMELEWLETIHGESKDVIRPFEKNLPTMNSNTEFVRNLKGKNKKDFAVGIFERDSIGHLIVLNKNIYDTSTIMIGLKDTSYVYTFKKNESKWKKTSISDKLTLTIKPGDTELIKLEN
ncbi:MAG: hypothetical protein ACFFC1_14475 [Promethearchaeota archaeon]